MQSKTTKLKSKYEKKKLKIFHKQLEIIELFGKMESDSDYNYKTQRNK